MRLASALAWCGAGLTLAAVAGCAGFSDSVVSPYAPPESPPVLQNRKAATANDAVNIVYSWKVARYGGVSDGERCYASSVFSLDEDTPDFGKRGNWIWLVKCSSYGMNTQEIWVNSRTGEVREAPTKG